MPHPVDTSWAIQALRGDLIAVGTLRRIAIVRPSISWVTLAELYDEAFRTSNPPAALHGLSRLLVGFRVRYPDHALAERFAEIRVNLRRRGQLISEFDIIIAATALEHDLTLLTFDARHFSRIPDLRLYQVERG